MTGVGRDLWGWTRWSALPSRVTYSRLHRTTSKWVLNTSGEGDSTTPLDRLFQGSVTLRVKKFFLMFRWNPLWLPAADGEQRRSGGQGSKPRELRRWAPSCPGTRLGTIAHLLGAVVKNALGSEMAPAWRGAFLGGNCLNGCFQAGRDPSCGEQRDAGGKPAGEGPRCVHPEAASVSTSATFLTELARKLLPPPQLYFSYWN